MPYLRYGEDAKFQPLSKGRFMNKKKSTKAEATIADKIRVNIVDIVVTLAVPIIASLIYIKVAGEEFVSTELGAFIMLGVVLLSSITAHFTYRFLFPHYSDDLGGIKF